MAINPDVQQELLAQEKSEIFFSISEYLQSLIVNTIYDGDYDDLLSTDPTQWTYNKLKTIGKIVEQAQKSADDLVGFIRPTIEDVVQVAYTASAEFAGAELIGAGKQVDLGAGWQGLSEYAIDALADGLVNRMEKRVNKLRITSAIQNDTTKYIENIVSQVVGGRALSDAQAQAVDELVKRGVSIFTDAKGKMWSIENYVPMYMRTASQQARVQGALDTYSDASQYLVYISDSPAECPYCRKYEGEIFRTTDDLELLPKKFRDVRHLNEAKNAKPVGLFHPNCTHQALMYIDGLTDLENKRDPNDKEFHDNRNEIRRVQKNKRRARQSMKHFKEKGQTSYYENAKANYNKWLKEEKAIMSYFERQGLGWLGTDETDVLLATMAGVSQKDIKKLKTDPFGLIALQAKQKFPTKLVSPRARDAIQEVLRPPDISTLRVDNIDQLSRKGQLKFKQSGLTNVNEFIISDFTYLSLDVQKSLNYEYYKYFEGDYGVYAYAKKVDAFHAPPTLPSKINSRTKFLKYVEDGGNISNEFGYWIWEEGAPSPKKVWHAERKATIWDKIVDRKIAEEKSAGALRNKKQYLSGGLPSSGKTRTISGKDPNPTIKTIDASEYVTLNSDDFKTMLIIEQYGTDTDKALHEAISDAFINSDNAGVNTVIKLDSNGVLQFGDEVWNDLKRDNRDVFDALFGDFQDGVLVGYKENTTFSESFLTEVKETIANRTTVLRTTDVVSEVIGFEAANFVHAESSDLLAYAREKVGQQGLNMIHDVTLGSDSPIRAIDGLIQTHGYKKAEGTFIIFTAEQARTGVVQRYAEGNFTNLSSKIARGRGGRYVSSGVIDSATQLVQTNADETIKLLGREAITDNEIYLKRLIDAGVVDTRLDGLQIIDRTAIDEASGYPKSRKLRLLRGEDGIRAIVRPNVEKTADNLWGLVEETEALGEKAKKPKVKIKSELPTEKFKNSLLKKQADKQANNFTILKAKNGALTRLGIKARQYINNFTSPLSQTSLDGVYSTVFGGTVPVSRSTTHRSFTQAKLRAQKELFETIANYKLINELEINADGKATFIPVDSRNPRRADGTILGQRNLNKVIVKSLDDAVIKINSEIVPHQRNHYLYIMQTQAEADLLYQMGVSPDLIYVGDSKIFEAQIDVYKRLSTTGDFPSLDYAITDTNLPVPIDKIPQRYTPLISDGRLVKDELVIPPILNKDELLWLAQRERASYDSPTFDKLYPSKLNKVAIGGGEAIEVFFEELDFINQTQSERLGADLTFYSSADAIAHYKSALGLDHNDNIFVEIIQGNVDADRLTLATQQVQSSTKSIGVFTNESSGINRAVVKLKKIVGMNYKTTHNVREYHQMLEDAILNGSLQTGVSTTANDDARDLFELTKQALSNERYIDAETGEEYLFSVVGKHIKEHDGTQLLYNSDVKIANTIGNVRNRHVTDFINVETRRIKITVKDFIKQLDTKKYNVGEKKFVTKKAEKYSSITKRDKRMVVDNLLEQQREMVGIDNFEFEESTELITRDRLEQTVVKEYGSYSHPSVANMTNGTTKDYRLIKALEELDPDTEIEVALVKKDNYDLFMLDRDNPLNVEFKDMVEEFDSDYVTEKNPTDFMWRHIQDAEEIDIHIYAQGNRANQPITVLRGDNLRLNTAVNSVSVDNDYSGLHRINQTSKKSAETIKMQMQIKGLQDTSAMNTADSRIRAHKGYMFIEHKNIDLGTTQATTTTKSISGKKVAIQFYKEAVGDVKPKIETVEIDLKGFKDDVRRGMLSVHKSDVSQFEGGNSLLVGTWDKDNKKYFVNGIDIAEFNTVKEIRKVIPVSEISDADLGIYLFSIGDTKLKPQSTFFVKSGVNLERLVQFSEDVTIRDMLEVRLNKNTDKITTAIKGALNDTTDLVDTLFGQANQDYALSSTTTSQMVKDKTKMLLQKSDKYIALTQQVDANFLFKDKLIEKAVQKGYISDKFKEAVDVVDRTLAKFGGINNIDLTKDEFIDLLEAISETTDTVPETMTINIPETLASKLRAINADDVIENSIVLKLTDADGKYVTDSALSMLIGSYQTTEYRVPRTLLTSTNQRIANFISDYNITIDDLDEIIDEVNTFDGGYVPNKNELVARFTTSADISNTLNDGIRSGELLNISTDLMSFVQSNSANIGFDLHEDFETVIAEWKDYQLQKLGHSVLFNADNVPLEIVVEDLHTLGKLGLLDMQEVSELRRLAEYSATENMSNLALYSENKYIGTQGVLYRKLADVTGNTEIKNMISKDIDRNIKEAFKTNQITLLEPLAVDVLNNSQQKNTKLVLRYGNEVGSDLLDLDNKTWTEKLVLSEKGDILVGFNEDSIFDANVAVTPREIKTAESTRLRHASNVETFLETNNLVFQDSKSPSVQAQQAVLNSVIPDASEIQLGAPASTSSKTSTAYDFSNSQFSNNTVVTQGNNVYSFRLEAPSTIAEYQLSHTLPVRHISRIAHEYEYIIPSDAKFEVMGTNVSPQANAVQRIKSTIDVSLTEKQFQSSAPPALNVDWQVQRNKEFQLDQLTTKFKRLDDNMQSGLGNGVYPDDEVEATWKELTTEQKFGGVYVNPQIINNRDFGIEEMYIEVVDLDFVKSETEGIRNIPTKSFRVKVATDLGSLDIIKALTSDEVLANIASVEIPDENKDFLINRLLKVRETAFGINPKSENAITIWSYLASELVQGFSTFNSNANWVDTLESQLYDSFMFSSRNKEAFDIYIDVVKGLGK